MGEGLSRQGRFPMARPCSKVRLENGLKLDLNNLARLGLVKPGSITASAGIVWTHSYWGEIAHGVISARMEPDWGGWLRIQIATLDQRITLVSQARHLGGRQWYFICPATGRRASVLWKVPGADRFYARQTFGRQVAYSSQCVSRDDRAHQGQAKIKSWLCSVGDFDPDEWDFPPKPKWMRWRTYNKAEDRFDRYEEMLEEGLRGLLARFLADS